MKVRYWALTCVLVGALTGLACTGGDNNPPADNSSIQQDNQPAHNSKTIGAGRWKVGFEIDIGRYITTVPATSNGCYWARLRDFKGNDDSIIVNGTFTGVGTKGEVIVRPSDEGVEFIGMCLWTKSRQVVLILYTDFIVRQMDKADVDGVDKKSTQLYLDLKVDM